MGERGIGPKSLMEKTNGCLELHRCSAMCSRLDGDGSLRQLSFHHVDEVQVPEAHVHAQDLAKVVTSHPRPGVGCRDAQKAPTWRTNCRCFE